MVCHLCSFKSCQIVGNDLISLIVDIFQSSGIPGKLNYTNIVVIPKGCPNFVQSASVILLIKLFPNSLPII